PDAHDVVARLILRILEDFVDGIDRAARNLCRLAQAHEFVPIMACGPRRDVGVDKLPLRLAPPEGAPLAFAGEFACADGRSAASEDLVTRAGDRDPAPVLGRIMAVRHHVDRAGAHALTHETVEGIGGRQLVEYAEDRLIQANVDDLPAPGLLARAQREQRAERAVE